MDWRCGCAASGKAWNALDYQPCAAHERRLNAARPAQQLPDAAADRGRP
jgi:hypothetical protein